jgi:hypothetical protein
VGFYYDRLPIANVADGKGEELDAKYFEDFKDADREKEIPEMLAKVSKDMKIPCDPATVSASQKETIRKGLLTDLKIDPKLAAKLAGDHPYVLAAIVDRYGRIKGTRQVQVREKENDKRVDYFGRRSTLETHDAEEFNIGFGWTASLTFVAFSAKDGHVVWQANDSRSIQAVFLNSQKDVAKGCMENIFHNLIDTWKRNQEKAKKLKEEQEKADKKAQEEKEKADKKAKEEAEKAAKQK